MAFVLGAAGLLVASLVADPPVVDQPVPPVGDAVAPVQVVPAPVQTQPPPVPTMPDADVVIRPDPPDVTVPDVPATPAPEPGPLEPPRESSESEATAPVLPDPPPAVTTPADDRLPAPAAGANVRVNRPGAALPVTEPELPELALAMPLIRYAADFDYAADLPLLAVVLLDDPTLPDAPALLGDLPFVPSVVLNAAAPDVTARMRAYRDAGIEVMLQAALPAGAQPSDVENTYQRAFDLVPEAIAVFSDGTGPEAGPGAVADQMMQVIGAEGRGFVTVPRGLGAMMRPAEPGDVPMTQITRDVDSNDETQAAIERGLAQVAFRARQTGEAVLLARITPDTLAALRNWANRSDPGQLSLVPVSAVLIAQLPPP